MTYAKDEADRSAVNHRVEAMKTLARNIRLEWSQLIAVNKYANGPAGNMLWEKLNTLGPEFTSLVLDPGIAIHIDEFVNFVNSVSPSLKRDVWTLREEFSKFLGNEVYFRALKLTDDEAFSFRDGKIDMYSKFALTGGPHGQRATIADETSLFFRFGPQGIIKNKLADIPSRPSPLLSVSKHKEVAIYAASLIPDERRIYLFELSLPKLDVFYQSTTSTILPYQLRRGLFGQTATIAGLHPGQSATMLSKSSRVQVVVGPDFESFVPFAIDHSEIQGVHLVTQNEIPEIEGVPRPSDNCAGLLSLFGNI